MVHSDSSHAGSSINNILIIGDTDLSRTILHFLSQLHPPRRLTLLTSPHAAPTPDDATAAAASPPLWHHLTRDLDDAAALRAAFAGQDLVISTANAANYAHQTRLINAAVAARVPRFMPAEFGQDSLNAGVAARLPPHEARARVVRFLRAMESEGPEPPAAPTAPDADNEDDKYVSVETTSGFDSAFSWVAVAVGAVLDTGLVSGELGFDIKWQSATVHGTGAEAFAVSSLAWVGRLVARVVERWDGVRNRYLYAAGAVTTADEVVACLQKATAKEWAVGKVETAECVREAEGRAERGFPDAGMVLMQRSVLYDQSLGAVEPFKTKSANEILGLAQEKVEDIVEKAVHDFEHHGKAECGCE